MEKSQQRLESENYGQPGKENGSSRCRMKRLQAGDPVDPAKNEPKQQENNRHDQFERSDVEIPEKIIVKDPLDEAVHVFERKLKQYPGNPEIAFF